MTALSDITHLTTDELVAQRARTRLIIKRLENTPSQLRTVAETRELTALRADLRRLMKECGRRFIQPKLL